MEEKIPGSNKTILIRTEGGRNIGMGHIMRSLSIAHAIKERGLSVSFIVNDDKAALDAIASAGYPVITRDAQQSSRDIVIKYCRSFAAVIFDTKRDVSGEVQYFKEVGLKIIIIDNQTSAAKTADLVIIPSLNETCNSKTNSSDPRLLEGPRYFPLNHIFIETGRFHRTTSNSRLRILVTMGGADPNNLTTKVVKTLQGMEGIDVKVVIGPSMDASKDLMELNNNGNFVFQADVKKMSLLMRDSDIAFTSFGITLFELAYMGVPSIVIANYREDKEDMDIFNKIGVGIPLGYYEDVTDGDIRNAVELFLHNRELHEKMSKTGRALVDGRGVERIVNVIESIGINSGVF